MDRFKLLMNSDIGVGGYKCYCCGPADRQDEKRIRRMARHRLKNETREELNSSLNENNDRGVNDD